MINKQQTNLEIVSKFNLKKLSTKETKERLKGTEGKTNKENGRTKEQKQLETTKYERKKKKIERK